MPDLNKLPVPKYDPLYPYHWEYDNIPIDVLALRDELINNELEKHAQILRDSSGNQGTLDNRLNQSIEEDGSLKSMAIDESSHNIAEHTDGTKELNSEDLDYIHNTLNYNDVVNPVSFVRMLEAERNKLALVASEATNIKFEIDTPSNTLIIEEGKIHLASSDGITWDVSGSFPENSIIIKPNLAISTEFAHRHYYDIEPITLDYINYKVTSVNTPYMEGSLRVYINGIKISSSAEVYVPGNLMTESWSLNGFTSDHENGTFQLNSAITEDDIIRIDFDVLLS